MCSFLFAMLLASTVSLASFSSRGIRRVGKHQYRLIYNYAFPVEAVDSNDSTAH